MPGIVQRMEELIAKGRARSPKSVLQELERGSDALLKWAKTQHALFIDEDVAMQTRAANLLAQYYDPAKPAKGISGADPFVIALADLANPKWLAVSAEKPGSRENPKIPYVCTQQGIPFTDFLGLMRAEGWSLK